MSADQTLARIDATLEDYDQWDGYSPDAARWVGGPTEGEWPEKPYVDLSELGERLFAAWRDAMREFVAIMERSWPTFKRFQRMLEPPPKPKQRTPSAERTSSPRRRAGSRRTKRQARRRHG